MSIVAHSIISHEVSSFETGTRIGAQLREKFEEPPVAIVAYATANHDHPSFLRGIASTSDPHTLILGCSTQGVMGNGLLLESGYVSGAMGLGGHGVSASRGLARDIQEDSRGKGRALGAELLAGLAVPPKVVVVAYDPLCGADVDALLAGLHEVVQCPIVGGGAGHTWGPLVATYQFSGREVLVHSAVALALGGELSAVLGCCHGTTPIGLPMTVTRAEGMFILELDGRPAAEVWAEITGEDDPTVEHLANVAIGLPDEGYDQDLYRVLAPFGVDLARGAISLQAALPTGTEIMLHHRTEKTVLEGTRAMGERVRQQLAGRQPRAVLGFECGARTAPFLGTEVALKEVGILQEIVGRDAAWLGMLAWGEVFQLHRGPAVFNYTYPLLCLTD